MMKHKHLNSWFWKWHIIAGLITLPFMLLLSITGIVYLFKTDLNDAIYQEQRFVLEKTSPRFSFQSQLDVVNTAFEPPIRSVSLPVAANQATAFALKTTGHSKHLVYVDPYTNEITGEFIQKNTLMHKVRKLHGELLLGKLGTLTVELVASWFLVLILTGMYIWWPSKGIRLTTLFWIRTQQGSRIFWRDLHAVLGIWLSVFMLVILSGGMPWTDVFGSSLKWVQQQTDTGYPQHWRNAKGLSSLPSNAEPRTLDDIVAIAEQLQLEGSIQIKLPQMSTQKHSTPISQLSHGQQTEHTNLGVYTISNRAFLLRDQTVIHVDQYSGAVIKQIDWNEVGILMVLRQVAMRLHQGEYGFINWIMLLFISLTFSLSTLAGLISYLKRKPSGRWGLPKPPQHFVIGKIVLLMIAALAIIFPLFGASLLLITIGKTILTLVNKKFTNNKNTNKAATQ